MKRALIILVVSCVCIGALPTVALGHTKKFPVTSSWAKSMYMSGTVSSPKAACVKKRTVGIYDVSNPDFPTFVTGATTNDNGYWQTHGGFFGSPKYKLVIAAKVLQKNANHKHKCKALNKTKTWKTAG